MPVDEVDASNLRASRDPHVARDRVERHAHPGGIAACRDQALAFVADPLTLPGLRGASLPLPGLVRGFGARAVGVETAHPAEAVGGCAWWFPPGESPDGEILEAVAARSIPRPRHEEVSALCEAMGEAHPNEPHWYQPLIEVEAVFRGRGLGLALLCRPLEICDRAGLPAYLEATTRCGWAPLRRSRPCGGPQNERSCPCVVCRAASMAAVA